MKLAVDVAYHETWAVAAGIGFVRWTDEVASWTATVTTDVPAPYVPGRFAERELPPILALIAQLPWQPELIVVDAYVDLGPSQPGLGRRLHEATGIPVLGVAKRPFPGAPAQAVCRGGSARPLYVTAAGRDPREAAERIRCMHGHSRMPTLLAAADRLAGHG